MRGRVGIAVRPVQINLLRGFELVVDDVAIDIPASSQRLVAYLALHERPQPRSSVASSLWIDFTEERAGANLRSALWKLRHVRDQVVTARSNFLGIGHDVEVDVAHAVRRARELLGEVDDVPPTDLHLLSGDLLPDWDEDWILFERERLRQLRIHAIEALGRRCSRAGQHADAVEAGLCAVAADPLRESAQRVLIEAHIAEGNVADAQRQYRQFALLLWDALGILPSPELRGVIDGAGRSDHDPRSLHQSQQLC